MASSLIYTSVTIRNHRRLTYTNMLLFTLLFLFSLVFGIAITYYGVKGNPNKLNPVGHFIVGSVAAYIMLLSIMQI